MFDTARGVVQHRATLVTKLLRIVRHLLRTLSRLRLQVAPESRFLSPESQSHLRPAASIEAHVQRAKAARADTKIAVSVKADTKIEARADTTAAHVQMDKVLPAVTTAAHVQRAKAARVVSTEDLVLMVRVVKVDSHREVAAPLEELEEVRLRLLPLVHLLD